MMKTGRKYAIIEKVLRQRNEKKVRPADEGKKGAGQSDDI